MRVKDLVAALDGVDPEALVVVNYNAEEAWIVDRFSHGFVRYPPIRGNYCDYSVDSEYGELEPEEGETFEVAFMINAG